MGKNIGTSGKLKMPHLLYLIEIVMAYNLSSSLYKFSFLATEFDLSTFNDSIDSLYILFSTILSSELTVRSMVRLPSAIKSTWRFTFNTLVVQAAIIIANVYLFDNWSSNPLIESEMPVAALCLLCTLILFLPHIRRYYTPPNTEVPKAWDWILYVLYKHRDEKEYRYTFGYEDLES